MRASVGVAAMVCDLAGGRGEACVQDSDTLAQELVRSAELARAILDGPTPVAPEPLRRLIAQSTAKPNRTDPAGCWTR